MPIAHCIVHKNRLSPQLRSADPVALWAEFSGQSAADMTINLVASTAQYGRAYPVMASLLLPTAWSDKSCSALQLGLARALAQFFDLPAEDIHVVTQSIEPGQVVEAGREARW